MYGPGDEDDDTEEYTDEEWEEIQENRDEFDADDKEEWPDE